MARIESMLQEFEDLGYKVLKPQEYKTLESQMSLICKNGHNLTASLKDIRKESFVCEECNKAQFGGAKHKLGDSDGPLLVAIDGATVNMGMSLYQGTNLIEYRAIGFSEKKPLAQRLHDFRKKFLEVVVDEWHAEYVVVENIQLQSQKNSFAKFSYYNAFLALANLQGVIVEVCVDQGLKYHLVSVNEWRSSFGIAGCKRNEAKSLALKKVDSLFGIKTKNDDVAEAILIGAWGSDQLKNLLWGQEHEIKEVKKLF